MIGLRYMLLAYGCDRPEPGDARYAEALGRVNAFTEECRRRGVLVAADALKSELTATTVRVREGTTLTTDGPFAETHEHLGGYFLLDCASLDDALELAAMCPMASSGAVEVRPLATLPGWSITAPDGRPAFRG